MDVQQPHQIPRAIHSRGLHAPAGTRSAAQLGACLVRACLRWAHSVRAHSTPPQRETPSLSRGARQVAVVWQPRETEHGNEDSEVVGSSSDLLAVKNRHLENLEESHILLTYFLDCAVSTPRRYSLRLRHSDQAAHLCQLAAVTNHQIRCPPSSRRQTATVPTEADRFRPFSIHGHLAAQLEG